MADSQRLGPDKKRLVKEELSWMQLLSCKAPFSDLECESATRVVRNPAEALKKISTFKTEEQIPAAVLAITELASGPSNKSQFAMSAVLDFTKSQPDLALKVFNKIISNKDDKALGLIGGSLDVLSPILDSISSNNRTEVDDLRKLLVKDFESRVMSASLTDAAKVMLSNPITTLASDVPISKFERVFTGENLDLKTREHLASNWPKARSLVHAGSQQLLFSWIAESSPTVIEKLQLEELAVSMRLVDKFEKKFNPNSDPANQREFIGYCEMIRTSAPSIFENKVRELNSNPALRDFILSNVSSKHREPANL